MGGVQKMIQARRWAFGQADDADDLPCIGPPAATAETARPAATAAGHRPVSWQGHSAAASAPRRAWSRCGAARAGRPGSPRRCAGAASSTRSRGAAGTCRGPDAASRPGPRPAAGATEAPSGHRAETPAKPEGALLNGLVADPGNGHAPRSRRRGTGATGPARPRGGRSPAPAGPVRSRCQRRGPPGPYRPVVRPDGSHVRPTPRPR